MAETLVLALAGAALATLVITLGVFIHGMWARTRTRRCNWSMLRPDIQGMPGKKDVEYCSERKPR
jgi:hypothetical protein